MIWRQISFNPSTRGARTCYLGSWISEDCACCWECPVMCLFDSMATINLLPTYGPRFGNGQKHWALAAVGYCCVHFNGLQPECADSMCTVEWLYLIQTLNNWIVRGVFMGIVVACWLTADFSTFHLYVLSQWMLSLILSTQSWLTYRTHFEVHHRVPRAISCLNWK